MQADLSLKQRRSCRKYTSQQISEQELDSILEAGLYAASGMNKQASIMVAVTNQQLIAELSAMNASIMGVDSDPFYGANCVVIVFADSTVRTYLEDGSLSLGNMMNAAHAIGVSSCWIHRAKQMFETKRGKELMKQWNIDEKYVGIGNLILGYADEELVDKPRREGRIIKIK